jgi:hypothetical protein
MTRILAAVLALAFLATPAMASNLQGKFAGWSWGSPGWAVTSPSKGHRPFVRSHWRHRKASGFHRVSTGRPGAWCGWWMRANNGRGDPGPEFNLARNWAHWGAPSSVVPGAVVVYPHHVVRVVAPLGNGMILATSGNDGHRVRTRARSLSGAIAVRG